MGRPRQPVLVVVYSPGLTLLSWQIFLGTDPWHRLLLFLGTDEVANCCRDTKVSLIQVSVKF